MIVNIASQRSELSARRQFTTADMQALLLDRLDELAAKQDEIRAMLIELQRPPTSNS